MSIPDDTIRDLARKTAKAIVDHGSIPMATLKESIILQEKVDTLLAKEIEFPEPQEIPEVDLTPLEEKLSEVLDEVKKKDSLEYDLSIDEETRKKLKGDKGEKGKDGKDGKDGKSGVDGKDGTDGVDGKDGSQDTPEQIVEKLEGLKGDARLDISAIKGIDEVIKKIKETKVVSGGARLLAGLFDVNIQGATNGQALVYNSTTQKWENGTAGGGAGSGTVTNVSVTANNGITQSVSNPTTTPNITLGLNNITPTSVAVQGTAGAGYITLPAQSSNPAAPSAGTLLLHSSTTQGFTRMEQDNEATTNIVYGRDTVIIARNMSGSTLAKGTVAYVSGSTGNVPNIAKAQANSISTMPSVCMVVDDITNNSFGQVMVIGILSGFDTSAFTTGDRVYVSPTVAGGLTNVRPSGTTNFVQRVGSVLVSGVGNGSILVDIAPAVLNMETGTNAATWTGSAIVGTSFNGGTLSGNNSGDNAVNTLYSGLAGSKQDNIILTTTGTSGAATLIGSTLNIPQYSGGGGSLTLTTAEVDLGTVPRNSGSFTITTTGLTSGKAVMMQQAVGPYTGKGTLADEAEMDSLIVSASTTSTTTIVGYWNSPTFVKGNFKFNYVVSA